MSRAVLDKQRRAGEPLAAQEIARRVIAERSLNTVDGALARAMARRVDMALRHQRTNGMVQEAKEGAGERWSRR